MGVSPDAEEWRPVAGFEGAYDVSSHGRVRSRDRLIVDRLGRARVYEGRVLRLTALPSGHLQVGLWDRSAVSMQLVHRLVALAFIGPCPENMECCHNDGDPTNNRVANLRWDTHAANLGEDAVRHGVMRGAHTPPKGVAHGSARVTDEDVIEMRRLYRSGITQSAIGQQFGLSQAHVSKIVRGLNWSHVEGM